MSEVFKSPEGQYLSSVKVGPKGQIVIPKAVRDMFGIAPGDTLMLLADRDRGMALHHYGVFSKVIQTALDEHGVPIAERPFTQDGGNSNE